MNLVKTVMDMALPVWVVITEISYHRIARMAAIL
jgi:hypothetical protein